MSDFWEIPFGIQNIVGAILALFVIKILLIFLNRKKNEK